MMLKQKRMKVIKLLTKTNAYSVHKKTLEID